jgi:uncharacterized membrane protein (DUF4010 family)
MIVTDFPETVETATRLAVAGLVGLAVGIERQRSGHASGPGQHFAGTRTLLLIGLLGGLGGVFVTHDAELAGTALILAGALLAVGAYVMTARRGTADAVDGTTETAALVVLALGLLAGGGAIRLASALGALVVLVLAEKHRLHGWVDRLDPVEMRAALHFAVLALVVLPVLPTHLETPIGDLTPRATWMFVLIISALNFGGHVARRVVGSRRGYAMTGALGGVVSSTAVTITFSRESRRNRAQPQALSAGVVAACTVLFPRVFVIATLLNGAVAGYLWMYFMAPAATGVTLIWWLSRRHADGELAPEPDLESPLRLGSALQMAAAFQLVLLFLAMARTRFGDAGVYASATVFGLTDVDALTVAMTRAGDSTFAATAARAIAVGIAANTALKAIVAATVGHGAFRRDTTIALAVLFAVIAASVFFLP